MTDPEKLYKLPGTFPRVPEYVTLRVKDRGEATLKVQSFIFDTDGGGIELFVKQIELGRGGTAVSTWVLFLFLGFSQPLEVPGYTSQQNCEQSGSTFIEERATRMPNSERKQELGYCLEVK